MAGITRTIVIDDITPEEAAAVFLAWNGRQQAAFFNSFKAITDTWPGAGWCQQCCALSTDLDAAGQEAIAKLAEWSADPYVAPAAADARQMEGL